MSKRITQNYKWQFFIAMLVYQRVNDLVLEVTNFDSLDSQTFRTSRDV